MPKMPQVKGDKLVRAFGKRGWYVDRKSGSHVIMRHLGKPGTKLVIPVHSQPVAPGTLRDILAHSGLSVEELKGLL